MSTVPPESGPATTGELSGKAFFRLVRLFGQPGEVFRELAGSPNWLWAIAVTIVVSLAAQAVLMPRIDVEATIRQSMAERANAPKLSDEQMEKAIAVQKVVTRIATYSTPVLVPVVFLLLGGLYFLGLRAVGSEAEYRPVFAAVTHAALPPTIVSSVLLSVVAMQRESFPAQDIQRMLRSNLAGWLDAQTPKALLALADAVDVFKVWQWILLAIALTIVGKVSRGKAVAIVAVVWGLWIAGKVALSLIF